MPQARETTIGRRSLLKGATISGAAAVMPTLTSNAQDAPEVTAMGELTRDEIIRFLHLEANATCGFVRSTFLSKLSIAAGGLPPPFGNGRPLGSSLYFMVTPGAPVRLHRIRNDQLYHYYLGEPLEVFLLHEDGTTARIVVGPDLRSDQRLQLLIPGNTFHTARLLGRRQWFLGSSTEWPGVVPEDVELGNVQELANQYPVIASDLHSIAASVQPLAQNGSGPRRQAVEADGPR